MSGTAPVRDGLPAALSDLTAIAHNFRWSWRAEARDLFRRLDPDLWERTHQNPVRVLLEIDGARLENAARDPVFCAQVASEAENLRTYLAAQPERSHGVVAYFSAEFAVTKCLRVFSGGLGVLAGDHLKSASDIRTPLVGVGLFYRQGYFTQELSADGRQTEVYRETRPESLPIAAERTSDGSLLLVAIPFPGRDVFARVWRADVGRVPLYLLDTDVEQNTPEDRQITDRLYGGDREHRIKQEMVLGIGGARALDAMGVPARAYHMNEGHAAFAAIERVAGLLRTGVSLDDAVAQTRPHVVFTTHTPVEAGHDRFDPALARHYLGRWVWEHGIDWDAFMRIGRKHPENPADQLCMTSLGLRTAGTANGVAKLHGVVSREMWQTLFPGRRVEDVPIDHVTNGVHLPTWVADAMGDVYQDTIGSDWQEATAEDERWARMAGGDASRIWAARERQREAMVLHVRAQLTAQTARRGGDVAAAARALDPDALTIVFARRFATYKRATLLLSDPDRLIRLITSPGRPVQFVFAGKAHPADEPGKEFLRQINEFAERPEVRGRFIFVENYDVELARHLVQGADVWLNTPRRPHEASGTSGMKAAANGALNLSVPDGWWAEAFEERNGREAPIGWSVGGSEIGTTADQDMADAAELYAALEESVVPTFYERDASGLPTRWVEMIRSNLCQTVPFFNTHRMVGEYFERFYRRALRPTREARLNALLDDAEAEVPSLRKAPSVHR